MLQSMGLQRVGHDLTNEQWLNICIHGQRITTLSLINIHLRLPQWLSWLRIRLPMQEMQVWSLCKEDPPEKETATPSVFLPGKFHGQRSLVGYSPWSWEELGVTEWLNTHTHRMVSVTEAQRQSDSWIVWPQGRKAGFQGEKTKTQFWTLWSRTWPPPYYH